MIIVQVTSVLISNCQVSKHLVVDEFLQWRKDKPSPCAPPSRVFATTKQWSLKISMTHTDHP